MSQITAVIFVESLLTREVLVEDINKRFNKLEINQLHLSLEKLRKHSCSAYLKMADSITYYSQLMPVIVISDESRGLLLVDGYLRVRALQKLGVDRCEAEIWECDLATALLLRLRRTQEKHLEAIEEANILDMLHHELGLSQNEIAKRVARDVSWVNRRLSLLKDLPPIVRDSHYQGHLSTWIITRVIQPLARANEEHANQLVVHLNQYPHSTREIQLFFKHYELSNKEVRNRMISEPTLFFESLKSKIQLQEAKQLNMGPEGRWKKNLEIIKGMVKGLQKLVTTVFYLNQDEKEKQDLQQDFKETQKVFLEFENLVEKHIHDITTNSSKHIKDACGR
jgi:ParB family transcriptional regulator, chromosome partitioning protein